MPGLDDSLRIVTQVDVNGIQAGMKEASSAVESETEVMNEAFRKTVSESERTFTRVSYGSTEAKHAIHGLGEEIGIHVPRFVQTFVAELGGVGPVLAAAFTPIAIVGIGEVLFEAGKKLYDFYENVVNLKAAFEAIEKVEAKFTEDQISLSNALLAAQGHLAGLAGGPVVEAKVRLGSLGDEIVDLGKMLDKTGKSFTDLGVDARSSIREFLKPVAAQDLEKTLQNVGFELKRVKSLLLNTDDTDSTEFKELQGAVQLLSSFYDTLALKVQKYRQELAIANAEVGKAQTGEAEKKARADEEAAKRAETARHQQVVAELNDAERAAKEKTALLAVDAKETAEFYKNIEVAEKAADKEKERLQEEQLHRAIEIMNKEYREQEKKLQKEAQLFNKTFDRITGDINKEVISSINGQETFGRAAQKVFTGLADSAITDILKIGEKWVAQHIIMAAISKLFHVQDAAGELAALTAKIAALKTFGIAEVGLAGASGVASMAAAPFPIDTTAPEFGASMAAAAAGFLAFEQGGIMPSDAPAMLHAKEMVLPAHISESVQRAADNGTMGGGGHTFNYTYNGSGSRAEGQQSHKDFMKLAKRELRRLNR